MARKSIKEGVRKILNDCGNEISEKIETAAKNKNYADAVMWQEFEKLYFDMRKKIYDVVGGFERESPEETGLC